jgi:thiamine pyrophosphate-dependent acetolactate synthase large subunit-like protein
MHLAEFETAARYDIPLLVAVINDQALGAEYHKMSTRGLDADIATHTTPDMAQLATAMGARGTLATRLEDIRDAVERFLEQPGPMLVDIRVSRNVLSLPFRRLYFGMDV